MRMPPKSWKWQFLGSIGHTVFIKSRVGLKKDGKDEKHGCIWMEELCAMITMCFDVFCWFLGRYHCVVMFTEVSTSKWICIRVNCHMWIYRTYAGILSGLVTLVYFFCMIYCLPTYTKTDVSTSWKVSILVVSHLLGRKQHLQSVWGSCFSSDFRFFCGKNIHISYNYSTAYTLHDVQTQDSTGPHDSCWWFIVRGHSQNGNIESFS